MHCYLIKYSSGCVRLRKARRFYVRVLKGVYMKNLSRRGFVKGAAAGAVLAGIAAMTGCSGGQQAEQKAAGTSQDIESKYDNTLSEETEELNMVVLGKDIKIAAIVTALQKDYYKEEKLSVSTQTVSGGFPEAMPALSNGSADVLPFGSIPSCTYIGQGDDLVIFGGTIADGSEAITLIENKDKYQKPEDFKGKKIGCFRMETGHMVLKSWLRENGIIDGEDVEFVLLEGGTAILAAVENGEVDLGFWNSGGGYMAVKGGKCAVAFRPNELIGQEFPCCRQTTNRDAFDNKRSALIKFQIANLRGLYDIENDKEGSIKLLAKYSGQDEEYVENVIYGKGDYVAAMKYELDPYTDDLKTFYGNMVDNGDIEDTNKDLICEHMDSTIYKAALDVLIERGENVEYYQELVEEYARHNTLDL